MSLTPSYTLLVLFSLVNVMLVLPIMAGKAYRLLLLIIFLTPLGVLTRIPGTEITIRPFIGLLLFAMWTGHVLAFNTTIRIPRQLKYLGLFLAVIIGTSILGESPGRSFGAVLSYIQLFGITFLLVQLCRTEKHIMLLTWGMLISLAITACFMVGGIAAFETIESTGIERVSSIYDSTSHTSYVLLLGFIFAITIIQMHKGLIPKVIAMGTGFFFASGIVLSHTLSSMLAGIIVIPLLVKKRFRLSLRSIALYAIIGVIMVAILFVAYEPFQTRISGHVERVSHFKNLRIFTFLGAARVFMDHPFFGVGAFNTEHLGPHKWPFWHPKYGIPRSPHNTYLTIAGDHGLAGLISLFIAVGMVIKGLYQGAATAIQKGRTRLAWLCRGVFVALIASGLVGMLINLEREDYLWFLLGMGIVLIHLCEQIKDKKAAVPQ